MPSETQRYITPLNSWRRMESSRKYTLESYGEFPSTRLWFAAVTEGMIWQ